MFPILLGKNNDLEKRVKTLEDSGGGGSVDILEVSITQGICNKTAKQIINSYPFVVFKYNTSDSQTTTSCILYEISEDYIVFQLGDNSALAANSENDYPEGVV